MYFKFNQEFSWKSSRFVLFRWRFHWRLATFQISLPAPLWREARVSSEENATREALAAEEDLRNEGSVAVFLISPKRGSLAPTSALRSVSLCHHMSDCITPQNLHFAHCTQPQDSNISSCITWRFHSRGSSQTLESRSVRAASSSFQTNHFH